MKGDFSRDTFRPPRHLSDVRQQQGRVQLDADWNELVDIGKRLQRTEAGDLIGLCGAPLEVEPNGSVSFKNFQVRAKNGDIEIAPGRIYVDGILCECEHGKIVTGAAQPDLPAGKIPLRANGADKIVAVPLAQGKYLAYLDVWEQLVSGIEDPYIVEKALNGPDTAVRTRTVWQVKFHGVDAADRCGSDINAWNTLVAGPAGKLAARAQPGAKDEGPCIVPALAGYRRLENQLYRVEVHDGGDPGTATFKWSRDNGAMAAAWDAQEGANNERLKLHAMGRSLNMLFASGQWVELSNDSREQLGQPGTLVLVKSVDGEFLVVDPGTATGTILKADFAGNPKVRRWDMASVAQPIEVAVTNDNWIPLEDGVEVRFADEPFRTGDYWLIPARTRDGNIEWPPRGETEQAVAPDGVKHHYCRLALFTVDATPAVVEVHDCRPQFPPVTQLTSLFYVSGDGQEAMPDLTQPDVRVALPNPLQAGVANGTHFVEGARVRFTIVPGLNPGTPDGRLVAPQGSILDPDSQATDGDHQRTFLTSSGGIASCGWELDSHAEFLSQQVEAELLDSVGNRVHLPIRFNANLSVAAQVAYDPSKCATLRDAKIVNVQDAIDKLCEARDREPGIVIEKLRVAGQRLENDSSVSPDQLAKGIDIECSDTINPAALASRRSPDQPVCYVSVGLPFPSQVGVSLIGFQPLKLAAEVIAKGKIITWTPFDGGLIFLTNVIRDHPLHRVLAQLHLKGNFILGGEGSKLYLDGDVFGDPRSALVLPSGDRRRGGNFEMWFWLAAPQASLGAVQGNVLDFAGGAVSGIKVTLTSLSTGKSRTIITDPQGSFLFPDVEPGKYTIEASGGGSTTKRELEVLSGQTAKVTLVLGPQPPPVPTRPPVLPPPRPPRPPVPPDVLPSHGRRRRAPRPGRTRGGDK